jgi:predicted dehydrogenase
MSDEMLRRTFLGTAAFSIVPRHVLGGAGFVPPSDKIGLAAIGMGRQGMSVSMELVQRPELQMVAVCDPNRAGKNYAEYGRNALLQAARRLLGPGHESWGQDLASPGEAQLTHNFKTSLGMGGREPAKRVVEAYYGSRKQSGTYKGCTAYADFRELLAKEKDVDAVYVATPDHWHAPIAIAAMRARKHVLGQKPMAHSIGEARRMAAVARETGVATSLTVNDPTTPHTLLLAGWLADGAIGTVREVHNWSSRPYWPQAVERPREAQPVPEGFDWNMWLGPAPERPYHSIYQPFSWRGWYDFGCGALGDMGCYSFAGMFKTLRLTPPSAIEASSTEAYSETYPLASIVRFAFPANGSRPALKLTWYDGGLKPGRPEMLPRGAALGVGNEGVLYIGDKGIVVGGFNGQRPIVYPESIGKNYSAPEQPRGARTTDGAIDQWIAACRGGAKPAASFEAQLSVTETIQLGNVAVRSKGEKLEWDSAAGRVTNVEAANALIDPTYRGDWPR